MKPPACPPSRTRDEAGHAFEDEVVETFEREKRPTLQRDDRFGTDSLHDVDGSDLGDIDVIALDRRSRKLFSAPAQWRSRHSIGPRLDRGGQSPRRS
jgi:hypothetical protein